MGSLRKGLYKDLLNSRKQKSSRVQPPEGKRLRVQGLGFRGLGVYGFRVLGFRGLGFRV